MLFDLRDQTYLGCYAVLMDLFERAMSADIAVGASNNAGLRRLGSKLSRIAAMVDSGPLLLETVSSMVRCTRTGNQLAALIFARCLDTSTEKC